jgi:hypothetical protein
VRVLVLAAAAALLLSPALAQAFGADSERWGAGHKQDRRGGAQILGVLCPLWQPSAPQLRDRGRAKPPRSAAYPLGSRDGKARADGGARGKANARLTAFVKASYAVQFKDGLSAAERAAALTTLREKYRLKIVKFNKGLDLVRVVPRFPRAARRPGSLGAALAPKIIQDLRKEPFVDAAYVDFPVAPKAKSPRSR